VPLPTIPTAKEIRDRIVSDLETSLNQTTPLLPKAFNRVLAGAIAGLILLLYQAILFVYRSIFPDTADITSLKLLGALVDVEQLPATFAVLTLDVPGTESYTVTVGTLWRGANNMVYKVTTAGVVTSGIAVVSVTAQESGEIGNLANGSGLDIVSPDAQLTGTATVTATTTDGDDAESDDSLRVRVSAAYKKRKTGGSPVDYEAWGLETPNFIWISPIDSNTLPGDVIVYGEVDNQVDGIPTQNQLDQLLEYLKVDPVSGLRDRHPIGPDPIPTAITREEFDIEIFIQDGTPAIETSITAAVIDYVTTRKPFNIATTLIRTDTISRGGISDVANDIANPQGATVTSANLTQVDGSLEIQSYQFFGGELGKPRNITFTVVI
jgi:phage-related baseplate assembly protein